MFRGRRRSACLLYFLFSLFLTKHFPSLHITYIIHAFNQLLNCTTNAFKVMQQQAKGVAGLDEAEDLTCKRARLSSTPPQVGPLPLPKIHTHPEPGDITSIIYLTSPILTTPILTSPILTSPILTSTKLTSSTLTSSTLTSSGLCSHTFLRHLYLVFALDLNKPSEARQDESQSQSSQASRYSKSLITKVQ